MRRSLCALALVAVAAALAAGPARAEFGVPPGGFTAQLLQPGAAPVAERRAGAHPDLAASFSVNTKADPSGDVPDGTVKDVFIDLPTGVVGNPQSLPACTQDELLGSGCAPESQVGTLTLGLGGLGETALPLYNLDPAGQHAARFAALIIILPVFVDVDTVEVDGRPRLRASIRNIIQLAPLASTSLTLWGVPADPSHDADRDPCLSTEDADACPSSAPRAPFLSNPTRCGVPTIVTLRLTSWEDPSRPFVVDGQASEGMQECGSVPFDPSVTVVPDTTDIDAPTGVHVDVDLPQAASADTLATAQIDRLSVTLPDGMSLSPAAADGLQACTDAQLATGNAGSCPDASQIGTAEFATPVLAAPIAGRIYLGSSVAGDPYRMFLVAAGTGLTIKITGSLRADEATGRLTIVFTRLPELPFSRLSLSLKGGPRAPLVTPAACGTATTVANLTPTSSADPVSRSSAFALGVAGGQAPCAGPSPFAPSFQAGVTNAAAGGDAAFALTLRRPDGHQLLRRIDANLPRGLAARLGAVPRCGSALAAVGRCDAQSRVGTFSVEAGAGSLPFPMRGDVYLTEPYRGGALGIAMAIRALAGPFDLGMVVVRASVRVDPRDGHLTIRSDPLPTVLKGIPLRVRTVGIDLDRPGFMLNPTGCGAQEIRATVESGRGSEVTLASPFQLNGCGSLRFRPRAEAALGGRRELRRGGHPSLHVRMRQRVGDANLKSMSFDLPPQLALARSNVLGICPIEQFDLSTCPKSSRIGSARARSPLLSTPLRGPVNLVLKAGRTPSLAVKLEGEPLRILVDGRATRRARGIRTLLPDLPDLPLRDLTLTLRGGRHGILAVRRDVCRGSRELGVRTESHSGKRGVQRIPLRMLCPGRERR